MRSVLIFLTIVLHTAIAHAQLSKGHWMVGGQGDYSGVKTENNVPGLDHKEVANLYRFSPGAGYFFMDRLCAGARFTVRGGKNEDNTSSENPGGSYTSREKHTFSGGGVTPFVRYYLLPAKGKINLFGECSYTYSNETRRSSTYFAQQNPFPQPGSYSQSQSKSKYVVHSLSIAAGPVWFIDPKVSVELSIGYTRDRAKKQDLTSNNFIFGTGFQVYLGKK